jgi:hypothetical protein
MISRRLFGVATLAIVTSLAFSAALAGGGCGGSVPSDQGGTLSTSTTSSTSASAASSGGMGGAGTGGATGTGGSPDCFPNPMTYVEIINACTNAQQVDVSPVLPLLLPDGGLPPLP